MTRNEMELIEIIRTLMLSAWLTGIMSTKTADQMINEKLEYILDLATRVLKERGL